MIIDAFTFFNELDLLDIRLHELDGIVDRFVIVEAGLTFTGKPKPLRFAHHRARYQPFLHKIRHVVITDDVRTSNPWQREAFQRNQIIRGLYDANDNDWVLVGDVDEIPSARAIQEALATKAHFSHQVAFVQSLHTYYVNSRCTTRDWRGTQLATAGYVRGYSPQGVRDRREQTPVTVTGGWHYSSVGGLDYLRQKIDGFSHQEVNTPGINNIDHLTRCMADLKDPMGRTDVQFKLYKGKDYPTWLWDNRHALEHLFYPGSLKSSLN